MVKPKRIEAGTFEFTTVGGNKQQAVTFDLHFDYPPVVTISIGENPTGAVVPGAGTRGLIWVSDITTIGFNFNIDSDVANADYLGNYIAIERRTSEKVAQ